MAHRPRRCRRIGRNRAATPAVCTCTHTIHVRRFACFACVSVVRVLPHGTFALPERQPSPWFRVHELTRDRLFCAGVLALPPLALPQG